MNIVIRRSVKEDLYVLLDLEKRSFPAYQQSTRKMLDYSLKSQFQQVWIAESIEDSGKEIVGSLIIYVYKKTIRIFSIVVSPEFQSKGIGKKLLQHAHHVALSKNIHRISLEVSADNSKLIEWYKSFGYETTELLKDYYEDGVDGFRMVRLLREENSSGRLKNILVLDDPESWEMKLSGEEIISSRDYIANKDLISERALRVFNLCDSYKYQSSGYYVSLLAAARDHRVFPNVTTISDFKDRKVIRSISEDIDKLLQRTLRSVKEKTFSLNIYFNYSVDDRYKELSRKLYTLFECPLIEVRFSHSDSWKIDRVKPIVFKNIPEQDLDFVRKSAVEFLGSKRFIRARLKNYRYYLAILTDPSEKHPPSDAGSLKKFRDTAEKLNVYTEIIHPGDEHKIFEFDALFIRCTTNVNDHTYRISRRAYAEGLAVIDDPWSILKCSNKIYLHERLSINKILTPKTFVIQKGVKLHDELSDKVFPLVLKQPDSAFSVGVTKVNSISELERSLKKLFKISDLILAQEFMPTDFDWRIGVLEGKPLFACKYFMAKDHWQIYNWSAESPDAGMSETIAIDTVPAAVLDTAVKAASLIGDGLYGVDLKEINGKVYVIEVNDNPNLDSGIEDKILKDELYERIMQSLIRRIEVYRNIERFVSTEPEA